MSRLEETYILGQMERDGHYIALSSTGELLIRWRHNLVDNYLDALIDQFQSEIMTLLQTSEAIPLPHLMPTKEQVTAASQMSAVDAMRHYCRIHCYLQAARRAMLVPDDADQTRPKALAWITARDSTAVAEARRWAARRGWLPT